MRRLLTAAAIFLLWWAGSCCHCHDDGSDPFRSYSLDVDVEPRFSNCTTNACGWTRSSARHLSSYIQRSSYVLAPDGSLSVAQLLIGASLELQDGSFEEESDNLLFHYNTRDEEEEEEEAALPEFDYAPCPASMRDFISCEENFSPKNRQACTSAVPCVVETPSSYTPPFRWPQCREQVRAQNLPSVPLLKSKHAHDFVEFRGNLITFSHTGTQFGGRTASSYIEYLMKLSPILEFGKRTRVALDIGGGSGTFGAELEKRGVLTLAITDKRSAENGVQLILERGFPGLVHVFDLGSVPYPNQAFDLVHCANCAAQWLENGLLLLEADRLVRSGGFIILSKSSSDDYPIAGITSRTNLCWDLIGDEGNLVIWKKASGKRNSSGTCPQNMAGIEMWPARLTSPPFRLSSMPAASVQFAKEEVYLADFNYWSYLTSFYLKSFGEARTRDIRNVIDMNPGYGGFAASLCLNKLSEHWWVLNVVPVTGPDHLPVIFDRGLIGVYHDWCKPLSVYPRTFDMLHASSLFSRKQGCNVSNIVLEMDRLLRPGGFALIRDKKEAVLLVEAVAKLLNWKTSVHDTESGVKGNDKLLHCQKSFGARRTRRKRDRGR